MADTSVGAAPSARFLQSRISALSTALIRRLENVFAVALDEDDDPEANSAAPAPPAAETATKQLEIEVESTALIRAAEEVMVLTRSMKEIWLFGGLNTIPDEAQVKEDEKRRRRLAEDTRRVEVELMGWLQRYPHLKGGKVEEAVEEVKREEEVEMADAG